MTKKIYTPTEAAADSLQKATGVEVKQYQFTKDAHYRVTHSFYGSELRESFEGKNDVSLSQVEAMIFSFEKRDGHKKDLEADGAGAGKLELVNCDLRVTIPCHVSLNGLFLPKAWISKKEKQTGNYTGSFDDALTAACELCKQAYVEDVIARNSKLPPNSPDREPIPYFTSREEVEAYLERQRSRGELKQSLRNRMDDIRGRMRSRQSRDNDR